MVGYAAFSVSRTFAIFSNKFSQNFARDWRSHTEQSMKKVLPIVVMMAMLAAACDDSEKKNCSDGALRCVDSASGVELGAYQTCVDGAWVQTDCPNGGVCNPESGTCYHVSECADGMAPVCSTVDGSGQVRVDESGKAAVLKYCTNGRYQYTDCGLGYCQDATVSKDKDNDEVAVPAHCVFKNAENPLCEEGAMRCNVSGAREACASGAWVSSPCPAGYKCNMGECEKANECEDGAKRCAGDGVTAQTCEKGLWKTVDVCSGSTPVCLSGVCTKEYTMDCSSSDFVEFCAGSTAYYCNNKVLTKVACEAPATCATVTVGSTVFADCFSAEDKCTAVDTAGNAWCSAYEDMYVSGLEYCLKASDGNLYNYAPITGICTDASKQNYGQCKDETQCEYTLDLSEVGGDDGGSDGNIFYCPDAKFSDGTTAQSYCNGDVPICVKTDSATKLYCYAACSSIGTTGTECVTDEDEGMSIQYDVVCAEIAGQKIMKPTSDKYTTCSAGCNAAGTACE